MGIDAATYRQIVGCFATGVTVVTTAYRKVREAKEGVPPALREPSTVVVNVLPHAPPDRSALSESEQLTMYLDRVRNTNNILRLVGISAEASDPQKSSAEARNPTSLSDVFISLRIDRYRGEPEEQAAHNSGPPPASPKVHRQLLPVE